MRILSRRTGRLGRLCRLGTAVLAAAGLSAAWATGALEETWSDARQAVLESSREAGFRVSRVLVSGREKTDRQTLIGTLGIDIGEAILAFDLEAARDRLSALPWVRDATVRRRLPDAIVVELVERRPLALWQSQGELFVIDTGGAVISGADAGDHEDLFLVVGAGAPPAAAELLAVMREAPGLAERVMAGIRVGERRWKLRLAGGIDVHLPEDGLREAWRTLAELERGHDLFSRDVAAIDLRLSDRLVVRLTPEARERLEEEPAEGEET